MENLTDKEKIVNVLRAWVNQRPGIDPRDYGDYASYRSESRRVTSQKHDAEELLRAVELSGMTAEDLKAGFHAFSGRLQLTEKDGEYKLDYCTGQYFPTEYRLAACAVLSSALWDYYRMPEDTGDSLRARFQRIFGKKMQKKWFD